MLKTNDLVRRFSAVNEKLRPLSDEELSQVQDVLVEMLSDLDELCRKHNIDYCLYAGTALGAVRHKGFIPWDEDVDIAIPRHDYDRFAELVEQELGEKYWLQSIWHDGTYDLPFLKIRKKGTRFVEVFEPEPQYAGVFIDIYALENAPDFPLFRWIHGMVTNFLQLCCSCVRIKNKKERYLYFFNEPEMVKAVKLKSAIGTCLSFFSLKKWCRITDKWVASCKNEKSKFVTIPGGVKHYFGELLERSTVFPLGDIEFAGYKVSAMADYAKHLSKLYGDYMQIPPPEKQIRHTILELELGENND